MTLKYLLNYKLIKDWSLVCLLMCLYPLHLFSQKNIINSDRVGQVILCNQLNTINKSFSNIRDTTITSDTEAEWPAKLVLFDTKHWLLAETSWNNHNSISRITTNSEDYITISGIKVGDRIKKLIDKKYEIDFNEGEGDEVFWVLSNEFSFGFTIEEKHSKSFYGNVYKEIQKKTIEIINPNARITSITVTSICDN